MYSLYKNKKKKKSHEQTHEKHDVEGRFLLYLEAGLVFGHGFLREHKCVFGVLEEALPVKYKLLLLVCRYEWGF